MNASRKNRTYARRFPVPRKEINVVKVPFTMRYSSRKFTNDKVITTACNFWRQIACSFQVMSGNILFLGNKIFEIGPFFQTRPGDLGKNVRACSLRFSALKVEMTWNDSYFELQIKTLKLAWFGFTDRALRTVIAKVSVRCRVKPGFFQVLF